jgi:hypothetical protein
MESNPYTDEHLAGGIVALACIEAVQNGLTLDAWYEVNEYRVMCDAHNGKQIGSTSFTSALSSYQVVQRMWRMSNNEAEDGSNEQ